MGKFCTQNTGIGNVVIGKIKIKKKQNENKIKVCMVCVRSLSSRFATLTDKSVNVMANAIVLLFFQLIHLCVTSLLTADWVAVREKRPNCELTFLHFQTQSKLQLETFDFGIADCLLEIVQFKSVDSQRSPKNNRPNATVIFWNCRLISEFDHFSRRCQWMTDDSERAHTHCPNTRVKIWTRLKARNQCRGAASHLLLLFISVEFRQNERHLHNGNNEFSQTINAVGGIDETIEPTITKVTHLDFTSHMNSLGFSSFVRSTTKNITPSDRKLLATISAYEVFIIISCSLSAAWIGLWLPAFIEGISQVRKIKRRHPPMSQLNWRKNYKLKWSPWPEKKLNWPRKMMSFWWVLSRGQERRTVLHRLGFGLVSFLTG